MSSAEVEASPSNSSLVPGSPEYLAHYYDKLEKSVYQYMAHYIETFPNGPLTKTWLSLGEDGQKSAIARMKWVLEYGVVELDIEDQEDVDRATEHFILLYLAELASGYKEIMAELNAKIRQRQKKVVRVEPANSLLKKAIRTSRVEKQNHSLTPSIPNA